MTISQSSISTLGATQIIYITAMASDLRKEYINIGANAHQLPRNPVAIHNLVLRVVPNVRGKAISVNDIWKALEKQGWTKNICKRGVTTAIWKLQQSKKLKVAKKLKPEWVKAPRGDGFRKIHVLTYFSSL